MTLSEIQEWIKSAKAVDTVWESYDSCSNHEIEKIYEKDGKFYKISFTNGHPYQKWDAVKGYVSGDYAPPIPVRKAASMIYHEEWVE